MKDDIIVLLLFLAFVVFIILFCYKGYKRASAVKKANSNTAQRVGATQNATLKHISGLPIAKGVLVEVFYGPEKIVFKKDGEEIVVARNKITSIDLASKAAITQNLVISYTSDNKNKQITLDTYINGLFALNIQKDFKKNNSNKQNTIEL